MIYDLNDCESRIANREFPRPAGRPSGIPAGIANSGSRVTSGLPLRCALPTSGWHTVAVLDRKNDTVESYRLQKA